MIKFTKRKYEIKKQLANEPIGRRAQVEPTPPASILKKWMVQTNDNTLRSL
jgi:hypothetical protein